MHCLNLLICVKMPLPFPSLCETFNPGDLQVPIIIDFGRVPVMLWGNCIWEPYCLSVWKWVITFRSDLPVFCT